MTPTEQAPETSDCDELQVRRFFGPYPKHEAYWEWTCACDATDDIRHATPLEAIDAARSHYRRKR